MEASSIKQRGFLLAHTVVQRNSTLVKSTEKTLLWQILVMC